MTQTIWKFPLSLDEADGQIIELPRFSQVRCLDVQGTMPCLWVQVRDDGPRYRYEVRMFGTGHDIPEDWAGARYCGTALMYGTSLVLHVFIRPTHEAIEAVRAEEMRAAEASR
jgi:hypothetical protein